MPERKTEEALCRAFFTAVLRQEPEPLRALFWPGAAVEWPCTNERFTVEEYVRANCAYPGDWAGAVVSILPAGAQTVLITRVWPRDKSASFHCVSLLRIVRGRIAALTEYWADDGPAPAWRRELGLGRPLEAADSDRLSLHVPVPDELWFYRRMLADPATMAYNAAWFPPDGCIPFPAEAEAAWYAGWVGQAPERFYAYLRRASDGVFVGDVNYHRDPDSGRWEIGVLIHAPQRGKGYGRQGLALLLDRAFRADALPCLYNEFESTRAAARAIHRAAGFREIGEEDGIVRLMLTREQYFEAKGALSEAAR